MAEKSGVGIVLDERAVPVPRRGARRRASCSGIDPLHVANEGKAVLGVRPEAADARARRAARAPARARRGDRRRPASPSTPGRVILDTGFGRRLLAEPEGEPLPRIC